MTGLPDETRVTMLLRKFEKSDHDLCNGENIYKYTNIVNRMCNTFSYGSLKGTQFRCLVFIHPHRDCSSFKHQCQDHNSYDTKRDSARAINSDRIQAKGEVTVRLILVKRMAY
ncbi:unnamed protein product [Hymenolepis diminuta]|uniref:Uncharacterized protein n=1 Tax=Hymenolepis diminuta TaxID=6216 RepID=A0A564YM24_HYMDI|nr:unnamed protein product [Hymenolepis diminuta]